MCQQPQPETTSFFRPPPWPNSVVPSVPRASRHSHTAYHAHSPLRPPTRRLQARFAAETRRILAIQSASRWTRHFASLHLHFICRYVAQLLLNALPLEPWHLDDGSFAPRRAAQVDIAECITSAVGRAMAEAMRGRGARPPVQASVVLAPPAAARDGRARAPAGGRDSLCLASG